MARPVEQVVKERLLLSHQSVQLVDEQDTQLVRGASQTVELLFRAFGLAETAIFKDFNFILLFKEFI